MKNIEKDPNQYLITLPKRGIKIIAPEHTQKVMALANKHKMEGTRFTAEEKATLWPETEKARLRLIMDCKILSARYPKPEDGNKFMENVDYQRREELINAAKNLTTEIVSAWEEVNPDKPIAVILFGSVAKGLVKKTQHPDPSNIDLCVTGDINCDEKNLLFDKIRPQRNKLQEFILSKIPFLNSDETNPGNAGVIIHTIEQITKEKFGVARGYYISSGAIPLYDPEGIWGKVEQQALQQKADKINKQKNHLRNKQVVFSCS